MRRPLGPNASFVHRLLGHLEVVGFEASPRFLGVAEPSRLRPWNLVWSQGLPIGIIDFDEAAPGARAEDPGYALWKHLNLGLVELDPAEQRRRLCLMAAAYGALADTELLDAIAVAQRRMERKIQEAPSGERRLDALAQNWREQEWLRGNAELLAS